MPSNINTQTDNLLGYGMDKANPGGLVENNDTIGQSVAKNGYFLDLYSNGNVVPTYGKVLALVRGMALN